MKTATVADLRNQFRRVSSWIENGETVEIVRRGKPFARLVPSHADAKKARKPDVLARLRTVWGERVFSESEVAAMRAAELDGEDA